MAVAPKNLIIPGKNSRGAHLGYKDDMHTIEIWANNLKAGGGIEEIVSDGSITIVDPTGPVVSISVASGALDYASLQGPGQTVTPGALTQLGAFGATLGASGTPLGSGKAFELIDLTTGGAGIEISSGNGSAVVEGETAFLIGGLGALVSSPGADGVVIANNVDRLNFFGNTGGPAGRQNVTGSRGGNVALASLLTILASMNLIADGSTP